MTRAIRFFAISISAAALALVLAMPFSFAKGRAALVFEFEPGAKTTLGISPKSVWTTIHIKDSSQPPLNNGSVIVEVTAKDSGGKSVDADFVCGQSIEKLKFKESTSCMADALNGKFEVKREATKGVGSYTLSFDFIDMDLDEDSNPTRIQRLDEKPTELKSK